MSFFGEAPAGAYEGSAASASRGPKLGFLLAWEAAYDAQARSQSMFGLEAAVRRGR